MSVGELESLRSAAMMLAEPERAKLASDLVASLDGPADAALAEAWDVEVCRRINEIEKDPAQLLDPERVLARARLRLKTREPLINSGRSREPAP